MEKEPNSWRVFDAVAHSLYLVGQGISFVAILGGLVVLLCCAAIVFSGGGL